MDSLLVTLQKFTASDKLPALSTHSLHPYAPESLEAPWEVLRELASTSQQLIDKLGNGSKVSSDAKTIALLKQHMNEANALFLIDRDTQRRVKALQERNTGIYGEDIPLSRNLIPTWCIEKIESCGKEAKLECFKEPQTAGDYDLMTLVFGGKVLVIDIVLEIYNAPSVSPRIELSSFKSTLATAQASSNSALSPESVDRLLFDTLNKYIQECQKPALTQDCIYARSLRDMFKSHLKQLSELDRLTVVKEEGQSVRLDGISWLEEVSSIGNICEKYALMEVVSVSSAKQYSKVPLDVFLLRGHSLPLVNLESPSMTFLIYISPLTYLSMLQAPLEPRPDRRLIDDQWNLNIPLSSIREYVSSPNAPHRSICATLRLARASSILQTTRASVNPNIMPLDFLSDFPPLCSLPNVATINRRLHNPPPEEGQQNYMWILDFTSQMLIVCKSRMRAIQDILDPTSRNADSNVPDLYQGASWLDLLFDPLRALPQERYTTVVPSTTPGIPPVRVTLAAPQELGFILGRVAVQSLHEVWAIFEIVKEQAWINETLNMHQWSPAWQRPDLALDSNQQDGANADDEFEALLNKTAVPKELQVAASITSFFDAPGGQASTSIKLQIPSRSFDFITVEVVFEPSEPLGIYVTVDRVKDPSLAEMARRGGFFSICGRVWEQSDGVSNSSVPGLEPIPIQLGLNLTNTFERLANI